MLLLLPRLLSHVFAIFIDQYRPSAVTLIVPLQRLGIWILVAKIQKAPPLIKRYLAVIFVLGRIEEVAEGINAIGRDASTREAHPEQGNDQVFIEGLVRPRPVELEAELYNVFNMDKTISDGH
jgi:hypothetical protein